MDIEELLLRKVAHPPRITRRWVLPCSRVVCLYRGYLGMHSHKINFPHHYSLQAIFASAFKAALLLHCTFGYNHKIGAWEIEFRTLQAWCSTSGPKAKFSTMTIIEFLQLSFLWKNPSTRAKDWKNQSCFNYIWCQTTPNIPAGISVKMQGFADCPNMFSAQQWTTPKSFSDSAL